MSYTRLGCIANASPKANRAVARHHQPSPQLIGSALPRPAFKLQKLTMDLISQMNNYTATLRNSRRTQPQIKAEDKNELAHTKALQALSNEHDVPYQATLRVVTVDGSKEPLLPPRQTRKHPGYIRNESGGLFTS